MSLDLKSINDTITAQLTGSGSATEFLQKILDNLGSGQDMDPTKLMEVQVALAAYNITVGLGSAIIKDSIDTIKSVLQRM